MCEVSLRRLSFSKVSKDVTFVSYVTGHSVCGTFVYFASVRCPVLSHFVSLNRLVRYDLVALARPVY